MNTLDRSTQRSQMVKQQIAARGVRDEEVLTAFRKVPREAFLPKELSKLAYNDTPLPIAAGATISQPFIVAFMIEALSLKRGSKVLEIGAGSGYAAALLAEIASEVFAVERVRSLAKSARKVLSSLNYDNVRILSGDGTVGWPQHAPYDAILVSAGAPSVPESLKSQLTIGGRIVIPVGSIEHGQKLVRITRKSNSKFKSKILADVRFVPLIGEEGWKAQAP